MLEFLMHEFFSFAIREIAPPCTPLFYATVSEKRINDALLYILICISKSLRLFVARKSNYNKDN